MDLNRAATFVRVVEAGSFTAAAVKLPASTTLTKVAARFRSMLSPEQ